MSGVDSLKRKFTDENPDRPSDETETVSFHSTPHVPEPPAPPARPFAAGRPMPAAVPTARLTMGLSRGTATPNGAALAAGAAAAAFLLAASFAPKPPLIAVAVILAFTAVMLVVEPLRRPVLADMERRFGIAVLEREGDRVRFSAAGHEYEGRLAVYGRRASLLDADGNVMEVPVRDA